MNEKREEMQKCSRVTRPPKQPRKQGPIEPGRLSVLQSNFEILRAIQEKSSASCSASPMNSGGRNFRKRSRASSSSLILVLPCLALRAVSIRSVILLRAFATTTIETSS
ncbi:hypothetical protein M9H77_03236 [Catharanthus roseus]|uniref:Uncharacterized protein n=1 Tax=Catharanthus roseus TaxID=4058 RepID=A0ACC0CB36_CATRO|nr:hypothetical protein M9H77_03236 [Catharanthus roseus]